ncbi:DNA methyltransferase [Helicobacter saguini]|uniref:DNA methyltransferase n=1 Tax=Helicobacter saguini TaxID=1548018 RepID=UPI000690FCEF|nr:DNA methyltransferase [Helicobacter saguini]
MKINDIDMDSWKSCDVESDSLWIIPSRDKKGKHKNIYHGNFIPQIANQLIRRYTRQNEIVLDAFLGSGTSLYECENLNRKCIGFDINEKILSFVRENMSEDSNMETKLDSKENFKQDSKKSNKNLESKKQDSKNIESNLQNTQDSKLDSKKSNENIESSTQFIQDSKENILLDSKNIESNLDSKQNLIQDSKIDISHSLNMTEKIIESKGQQNIKSNFHFSCKNRFYIACCDNTDTKAIDFNMQNALNYLDSNKTDSKNLQNIESKNLSPTHRPTINKTKTPTHHPIKKTDSIESKNVQFIIYHPPYMDIVKFTEYTNDLSHTKTLQEFLPKFLKTLQNTLIYLDKGRYFALVIGDVYKDSEVKPLSFYAMDMIKRNFKVKLKGIIVKNIEGNRGKLGSANIWRYRALKMLARFYKHNL